MNWIKTNPFVSGLAGITLVLCAVLFFIGSKSSSKYNAELDDFETSFESVSKSERIPLYPVIENKNAKTKVLDEYAESITDLKTLFDGYRPGDMEAMPTQKFTAKLKATAKEVTEAFEASGVEVPEGFFLGFERYQDKMAVEVATPILNYQLEGVKIALLKLAEAKPTTVIKVFRDPLEEETGAIYEPGEDDVSRNLGYEITFRGSENSARKFLTSLGDTKPYYYIVRCIKLENEVLEPPRISDAEFEMEKEEEIAPADDNPFGAGFDFPGADEFEETEEAAVEEVVEEAVVEEVEQVDTTRILTQVLGDEDVIMLVRFDLAMFLPAKKSTKP
ncbi:MAG: Amuc_1100 family pilus-like protein [Luteolibacter sp.]